MELIEGKPLNFTVELKISDVFSTKVKKRHTSRFVRQS